MGFFLLLLYLVVSYLSPDELYPELAPYRVILWIAVAAALASIPVLARAQWLTKLPQTYLLLGLLAALMLSHVAHLWFGGALYAFQSFMPALVIFFLVCMHVNTWKRLRILVFVIFGVALVLLGHGLWALCTGNLASPYLMLMNPESSSPLIRIRAVGYLSDPNDFAQFLLIVVPLVALAWTKNKNIRNFFLVLVPCTLLIYGIYLTHSRGALLALTVLGVILASRRVPLWVSVGSGTLFFVGLRVFGFTGGRDVSVEAGTERIDLWAAGLHMFRTSPLWGVGYGRFPDFAFTPLTAHNSFVLCLAEVGAIGCSCWLAALVISFLELDLLSPFSGNFAKSRKKAASEVREDNKPGANHGLRANDRPSGKTRFESLSRSQVPGAKTICKENAHDDTERVRRWANALRFSLIAFVVTSWFLSRTYTITLYVLLGMTAVLGHLGEGVPRGSRFRASWIKITFAVEAATIVVLYAIVRIFGLLVH